MSYDPADIRTRILTQLASEEAAPPEVALDLLNGSSQFAEEACSLVRHSPKSFPASFLFDQPILCSDQRIVLGPTEGDPAIYFWDHFIPPEYFEKGVIDERAVVFAFGVLGYKLLAGNDQFIRPAPKLGFWKSLLYGGVYGMMQQRRNVDVVPLSEIAPRCPTLVANHIHKAMSADPAKRFSGVREFFECLAVV